MKKSIIIAALPFLLFAVACKKDKKNEPEPEPNPAAVDNYSSLTEFFEKNGAQKQTFTFDAATGGSFTTPQSTTINIPPNAFQASGKITLEFKDIYQKSDMLLSDMPTNLYDGTALTSGGEMFIKALSNGTPVKIAPGKTIEMRLPMKSQSTATMTAFVAVKDTVAKSNVWTPSQTQTVTTVQTQPIATNSGANYYSLTMSDFSSPLNNGTWTNCDHPHFPPSTPQTPFKISISNVVNSPKVYMVFKSAKTMISVWGTGSNPRQNFLYSYAPTGYQCSVIVVDVNNGKLHTSITPVTIAANQSISVELNENTTENFKASLKALD
ncbi:MAG: hypothetical protein V4635_05245 [Bacteroidota bacterium]